VKFSTKICIWSGLLKILNRVKKGIDKAPLLVYYDTMDE
jgi:hypothetical protein